MMKRYNCESCRLDFDSDNPTRITHPDDLKMLGVTPEDLVREVDIYVCPECLKVPEEGMDNGSGEGGDVL